MTIRNYVKAYNQEGRYPNQKIIMVLDNARIHHAKLNLIEGLWGWMKKSVIHNVFYKSVTEIRAAVQGFISGINKTPQRVIDRLCIQL